MTATFQSTLPARGATGRDPLVQAELAISIHAPRTGSDGAWQEIDNALEDFNPRSPHGERLLFRALRRARIVISIHAPRTGSDCLCARGNTRRLISIHAPRTGSDNWRWMLEE